MELRILTLSGVTLLAILGAFGMAMLGSFLSSNTVKVRGCTEKVKSTTVCEICLNSFDTVKNVLKSRGKFRKPTVFTNEAFKFMCKLFKISSPTMCDEYVSQNLNDIFYILQHLHRSPSQICTTLLGTKCGKISPQSKPSSKVPVTGRRFRLDSPNLLPSRSKHFTQWTVDIPAGGGDGRPEFDTRVVIGGYMYKNMLRILHLTDVHFDIYYSPGSPANCQEMICCHSHSTSQPPGLKAGQWGSTSNCDLPYATLNSLFRDLARNDYDLILWTGDAPAHGLKHRSVIELQQYFRELTRLFRTYFPRTPLVATFGNHDSRPINNIRPRTTDDHEYSTDSAGWVYETMAQFVEKNVEKSSTTPFAVKTLKKYGYYTVLVKKGLRVISLQTNFCHMRNLWLILNPADPDQQLKWLIQTLLDAEQSGEAVYIIGHVPPGGQYCLLSWSWNYNQIVARFRSVIKGQFFGHGHLDTFQLQYDGNDVTAGPVGVAYIGPSATGWRNQYPGYREYLVNSATFEVFDSATYYLNITKANDLPKYSRPVWQFLYSARFNYGMPDLSPRSWENVASRMSTDRNLLNQFIRYSNRLYPYERWCKDDNDCLNQLCEKLNGRSFDPEVCRRLDLPFKNGVLNRVFPKICLDEK